MSHICMLYGVCINVSSATLKYGTVNLAPLARKVKNAATSLYTIIHAALYFVFCVVFSHTKTPMVRIELKKIENLCLWNFVVVWKCHPDYSFFRKHDAKNWFGELKNSLVMNNMANNIICIQCSDLSIRGQLNKSFGFIAIQVYKLY